MKSGRVIYSLSDLKFMIAHVVTRLFSTITVSRNGQAWRSQSAPPSFLPACRSARALNTRHKMAKFCTLGSCMRIEINYQAERASKRLSARLS